MTPTGASFSGMRAIKVELFFLVALVECFMLHLVVALPVNFEAAEPLAGGFMSTSDTLHAAADRLRADPEYKLPEFPFSATSASDQTPGSYHQRIHSGDSTSTIRSDNSGSSARSDTISNLFLTNPNYIWDKDYESFLLSHHQEHHYYDADADTESELLQSMHQGTSTTSSPSIEAEVRSSPLKGKVSIRDRARAFLYRILNSIGSKFGFRKRPLDSDVPVRFSFRTPGFPYSPTFSERMLQDTSVNRYHPYFGPESRLDPKDADRDPVSDISLRSRKGYGEPDSRNIPTSFVKADTSLSRVAEGLRPLRIPLTRVSSRDTNKLEGISDLFFKRKGRILPKLQTTKGPPVPVSLSKPPRSVEEFNKLSRLYFSRTGHVIPELLMSPPRTELVQRVDVPIKTGDLDSLH